MKINKKDFDRSTQNITEHFIDAKIFDFEKFCYWNKRANDFFNSLNKYDNNSIEYIMTLKNGVNMLKERNKYCKVPKRDAEFINISEYYINLKTNVIKND